MRYSVIISLLLRFCVSQCIARALDKDYLVSIVLAGTYHAFKTFEMSIGLLSAPYIMQLSILTFKRIKITERSKQRIDDVHF